MPPLTPEDYLEQLRALRAQVAEVTPLTAAERKALRNQTIASDVVLQASINIIDAHPSVGRGVDHTAAEVRSMDAETYRWMEVEGELRLQLSGVIGANLVRRQRVSLIAMQAYVIGSQLARHPDYADLIPWVEEIKRLRRIAKRRKRASDTPPEAPPAVTPE